MIKLLRVDHRLLHGQVAVSWFSTAGANTIVIANDDVANDETRKTIMRLAKPANAKLVMTGIDDFIDSVKSGVTDKYDMLVVVDSVADAHKLITETDKIKSLNLGGTRPADDTKNISKTINITQVESELLDELVDQGIEVEIRQLPQDRKIYFKDVK